MTALDPWENFYVIVGSSAGALIGLQFVVMTLLADAPAVPGEIKASQAFGTPNVVHFGVVLFLSALVAAPWESLAVVSILWGLIGLGGVIYALIVASRMRSQTAYHPVFEDWLFHLLLPLVAYLLLAVSAGTTVRFPSDSLFLVGAAALLLLFIGIHNAWDTVTYHVYFRKRRPPDTQR